MEILEKSSPLTFAVVKLNSYLHEMNLLLILYSAHKGMHGTHYKTQEPLAFRMIVLGLILCYYPHLPNTDHKFPPQAFNQNDST